MHFEYPKVKENWANRLWEEIRRRASGGKRSHEAPFEEIDLDNGNIDMEIKLLCGEGFKKFEASKVKTLRTLPSYFGEYEVQLANGYVERPLAILEREIVTSCGVKYKHTFTVVDFEKGPKYDIILGRPFMCQLGMI